MRWLAGNAAAYAVCGRECNSSSAALVLPNYAHCQCKNSSRITIWLPVPSPYLSGRPPVENSIGGAVLGAAATRLLINSLGSRPHSVAAQTARSRHMDLLQQAQIMHQSGGIMAPAPMPVPAHHVFPPQQHAMGFAGRGMHVAAPQPVVNAWHGGRGGGRGGSGYPHQPQPPYAAPPVQAAPYHYQQPQHHAPMAYGGGYQHRGGSFPPQDVHPTHGPPSHGGPHGPWNPQQQQPHNTGGRGGQGGGFRGGRGQGFQSNSHGRGVGGQGHSSNREGSYPSYDPRRR